MTQQEEIIRENLSQTFPAGSFDLFIAYLTDKVGIKNITQEQAITIANAISQITAPSVKLYGASQIGNWKLPVILNNSEKLNLINTNGREKSFFINSEYPLTIKAAELFSPTLANGEYIYLNIGDNFGGSQTLYKSIPKDTILGILNQDGDIRVEKQSLGYDLQQAPTVNFEFDNQTNSRFRFRMESQYSTKNFEDILPNTTREEQLTPYMYWNYFRPWWGADLRGESQVIILELWKADMSQLIANTYAYGGGDYQGWNWIAQIDPSSYNTQDYKLIAKYQ